MFLGQYTLPFLNAAKHSNKKIIFHDLERVDGRLVYNFDKLSQEAEDNSWLMFINPHNPGGTIFSKDELEDLAKIISKKNICMCCLMKYILILS